MFKNSLKFFTFNFLLFNILYCNLSNNSWQLPNDSRFYHEVTFLTSHNSFSNEEDGYVQPQQKWSLENQLKNGIRGFMLDTHYSSNLFGGKKKVRLCHNNCTLTQMVLRPFKGRPMSFKKSLKLFKKFLEENPKEIITLFLENYVESKDLDDSIESANIQNFILRPSIWRADKKNGWPKLSWMQKHNKRLVIFNQRGESKYIYDEWSNHFENQYGEIDIEKASKERVESLKLGELKDRYIFVMNYFPHFYIKPLQNIDFKKINYFGVRRLINKFLRENKIKRYPNFITVDFVNSGNLLTVVNKINSLASNIKRRKIMYKKIPKYNKEKVKI